VREGSWLGEVVGEALFSRCLFFSQTVALLGAKGGTKESGAQDPGTSSKLLRGSITQILGEGGNGKDRLAFGRVRFSSSLQEDL